MTQMTLTILRTIASLRNIRITSCSFLSLTNIKLRAASHIAFYSEHQTLKILNRVVDRSTMSTGCRQGLEIVTSGTIYVVTYPGPFNIGLHVESGGFRL